MRDLTQAIGDGMPVFPGDPLVGITPALTIAADGVAVSAVRMGSHTGTHVDAPAHSIAGGRSMADVRLDELVGDALVIRVEGLTEHEVCGWAHLTRAGELPTTLPPIVVIDTGWARWFRDDALRERHPVIDPDAAGELVARGMRVLAVDTLSPDPTDAAGAAFPVHAIVLGADGLIVENLCALEGLPTRVRVGFFPLRLGGDGAPVRAVAWVAPTVGELFAPGPWQWGMRGDPHAWREVAERLAGRALPDEEFTFARLIETELDAVVGVRLIASAEPVHVARFDPGHGMSAGLVDPHWWRTTGIPILVDRYRAARRG